MKGDKLFIISGPSGAGEDSIIDGLSKKMNIQKAISTTTRDIRSEEVDGVDYYFITKDEFLEKIKNGEMAEYAKHYNGNYYGITKSELERIQKGDSVGVLKIDYKGVQKIKELFPETIAIFIMADSLEELERRLRKRFDVNDEYVKERMDYTKEWLNHTDLYDYTVINKNGKLDDAIYDVELIIKHHLDGGNKLK